MISCMRFWTLIHEQESYGQRENLRQLHVAFSLSDDFVPSISFATDEHFVATPRSVIALL